MDTRPKWNVHGDSYDTPDVTWIFHIYFEFCVQSSFVRMKKDDEY